VIEVAQAQLRTRLTQKPCGLFWVHGDEPLLMIEAADMVRQAYRQQGASERSVFTPGRGFDWSLLDEAAGSMSLFASVQIIEIRLAKKPITELGEPLARWASRLSDDVKVIVSSPRLDKRLMASPWFKQVFSHPQGSWLTAVYPIDQDQLGRWINMRLGHQQQSADPAVLQFLVQRVEGNLLAAHQEIKKLGLLCPPGKLDEQAVRAAVLDVARYNAFDLCDAMLQGDANRATRCLSGLQAEGEAIPKLLWAVAAALRTGITVCDLLLEGQSWPNASRQAGLWAPRDKPYRDAVNRIRPAQLRPILITALQEAAQVDRISKGLKADTSMIDGWHGIERLVMRVAGLTPPRLQAAA
jgi:DNA polymerase III subunit delta